MKRIFRIFLPAGIILILIIVVLITVNPFKKDIWETNADKFVKSFNIISGNAVIDDLSQWTPFEWDTLYSFAPYTSKDKIYEVIGYKWDNITETVNEGMSQIVFVKDNKVICYLYGYPENIKIGFDFGEYKDSYMKFTSEQKLMFDTVLSDGIRYFYYVQE